MASTWINLGMVVTLFACTACGNDKPSHPSLDMSKTATSSGLGKAGGTVAARTAAAMPDRANAAGADREAEEAGRQPPLPERPFPKVGDIVPNDRASLHGGWSYTGGGFYGFMENSCCVDHYDQMEQDGSNIGKSLYVVTDPTERDASGGISKGRVTLIFYARIDALESRVCNIGGRQAVVAFADENWRNGSAYVTDGKTLRVTRWRDKAPPGCDRPDEDEERD